VESEVISSLRGGEFSDEGFHEFLGGGTGGGELRFQLVHQGHQLIDFGHDAALFGGRGDWNPIFLTLFAERLGCAEPLSNWKIVRVPTGSSELDKRISD
jgi:hypothetical protein